MRKAWLVGGIIVAAGIAMATPAKKAAPQKGFWKILVTPNAKWVLKDRIGSEDRRIIVRPVGIHQVGTATVAHLDWSMQVGSDAPSDHALAMTHAGLLNQVAVTDAGLYMFADSADDTDIAKALKNKPDRSDPPKAYAASKLNEGRYLTIHDDVVCMGSGPTPGEQKCEDTCEGQVCIAATDGVVSLNGNWAPDNSDFSSDSYH